MSHANRRTIVVLLGAALFAPAQLAADTAPAAGLPTQESPDTAPAAGLPTQESPDTAPAAGLPTQESLMDELKSGLYWRVNVLGFGVFQDLVDNSRLNPNNVLKVPTYQAAVNPRVDLNLNFRQLELGIKERFLYLRQGWN